MGRSEALRYAQLTAQQKAAYNRAAHAVGLMRANRRRRTAQLRAGIRPEPPLSLHNAAREAGTTSATLRKYARSALTTRRGARGPTPRPTDRLVREVKAITTNGPRFVTARTKQEASTIARHDNAVRDYLYTGRTTKLAAFDGRNVGDVQLETDLDRIDLWARRGELDFDRFYRFVN